MEVSNLDVIVWNGIITNFGVIKPFVIGRDRIRLANEEELKRYLKFQKQYVQNQRNTIRKNKVSKAPNFN